MSATAMGALLGLVPRGTRTIIVDEARSWTGEELWERATVLAGRLDAGGVRAGDRVVVQGGNSGDYVARIIAAWMLAATPVPVAARLHGDRLGQLLADSAPRACVIDDPPPPSFAWDAVPRGTTVIASSPRSSDVAVSRADGALDERVDATLQAALLMYTSGSTSHPMGVVCPPEAVSFALGAIQQSLGYREGDRVLCVLPLSFDYGLYQVLLAMVGGATVILEDGVDRPQRLPRLLADAAVTIFPGLPSLFGPLVRARWLSAEAQPGLRLLTSTGETFPAALIDALRSCLPAARIAPMYGMTECKRISIQDAEVPWSARHSVGRPLPGTRAWVGDDHGRPVPAGKEGELYVQGPHLMARYWGDTAATEARFVTVEGERTLRTGDVFRKDPSGHLTFIRRQGGFLKVRGHRLSPAHVEACLVLLPEVREAVAVGYTDENGEDGLAVFLDADRITPSSVRQQCAKHLPPGAVPALINNLGEPLPRNANGKYDRRSLARLAQDLSEGKGTWGA